MEDFNVNLFEGLKGDFNTFTEELNNSECVTEDIELNEKTLNVLNLLAGELGCSPEEACSYVLHRGVEIMKGMSKEELDEMFKDLEREYEEEHE